MSNANCNIKVANVILKNSDHNCINRYTFYNVSYHNTEIEVFRVATPCTDVVGPHCLHNYHEAEAERSSWHKTFNGLQSHLRSLMNKQAQFKVILKMHLNTHFFYSVEEFLKYKNDSCRSFHFLLFVVWTLYNMYTLYIGLLLCYLYSILKKKNYLSVL
jgi:hypothetical protein